MTWNNMNPLSNPFNQRIDGNLNLMRFESGGYFQRVDPKNIKLPQSSLKSVNESMGIRPGENKYQAYWRQQRQFSVPNQLDYTKETIIELTGSRGNIGPQRNQRPAEGEWNSMRMINPFEGMSYGGEWNDAEIMTLPIDYYDSADELPLSKADRSYWNYCDRMAKQNETKMSSLQKILLAMVDKGMLNTPSNLILVDDE